MVAAIDLVLKICEIFLVIYVVLSLLVGYRVIGAGDRPWASIRAFLFRSFDPVLRPLRVVLPKFGDIVDPAPPVLIIILLTIRYAFALYPIG
jgi:YggT family protein